VRKGMYLTDRQFWILNAWFLILVVASGWAWASTVLYGALTAPLTYANIVEISSFTAIFVSSIYYIRKLYKDKFAIDIERYQGKTSSAATFVYFFSRPLFAVVASLFVNLTLCEIIETAAVDFHGFSVSFFIHISAGSALVSVITGNSVKRLESLAS
jgi:hypothetical protein